jgi:hypothetical protein
MAKKGSVLTDRKTQIVIALIPVIGALIIGYWQLNKPSSAETQYSGRVIDNNTQQVITGAKVSVYAPSVPQIYYTDSEGVFYLKLVNSINSVRIRVESSNYEVFERNVSVSRTGIEDVRLMPARTYLTPTPSPVRPPSPDVKRPRIPTAPCTAERKAQGLC